MDGSCWWPRARCHWLPGSASNRHASHILPSPTRAHLTGCMYVLHGATGRVTAGHSGVVCLSLHRWSATDCLLLLPAAHQPSDMPPPILPKLMHNRSP
ncbi:hypothetical protein TRIATDRAFT_297417 [Trichoderma atroviride IMI 206040]|uniref:Uncharacterized protein n=1 Tax=Hypocrea atroviridis (strain ATCC 20476 / IMI 206040) TaxID=452589 RepID=G9NHI9_HYPAI|nr:uncharacterized protein TRIATDRAFT_297417 [Trichoderma atroviride IMI 206040]EHK50083.1 hypothetical protein TRIATDRAFT_297417 [Trichoderma atroviride IMI 206040]